MTLFDAPARTKPTRPSRAIAAWSSPDLPPLEVAHASEGDAHLCANAPKRLNVDLYLSRDGRLTVRAFADETTLPAVAAGLARVAEALK